MNQDPTFGKINRRVEDTMNMVQATTANELYMAFALLGEPSVRQALQIFDDLTPKTLSDNFLIALEADAADQRRSNGPNHGFNPYTQNGVKYTPSVERSFNAWKADFSSTPAGQRKPSPVEFLARLIEAHPNTKAAQLFAAEGINAAGLRYVEKQNKKPPQSVTGLKKYFDHKLLKNMNKEANEGRYEPFIGRDKEIGQISRILSRKRKPNVALTGEAGVGKTAIVEGLAQMIEDGNVPDVMKDVQIVSLDVGDLTAGTKFRGDFEKRVKDLIAKLKEEDNIVLFIDEYHTIAGAGSASDSSLDLANMLKPLLARGEIRLIAGTTPKEYKKSIRKDAALKRRTEEMFVEELSESDTIIVCRKAVKDFLAVKHGVKYDDEAINVAVRMSKRYMSDGRWPDKPLDLLDDAGADLCVRMGDEAERLKNPITAGDVMRIISENTGIQLASLDQGDNEHLKGLTGKLKKQVFNQDKPVEALSLAFKKAHAGMARKNGVRGAYVFPGPTGVGKTELAKALAEHTGMSLIRLDMSEYGDKQDISKIKGAPPGYVGFEDGGQLIEAVRKHPYSVVLLDEVEKAHPEVFKIFLQTLDDGHMTDNEGEVCDFRNTIFIMTTNLRVGSASGHKMGYSGGASGGGENNPYTIAVKQHFAPEFINRLDGIFPFSHLDEGTVRKVFDKIIGERVENLWVEKGVKLEISDKARQFIADKEYDKEMGGRPMNRAFDKHIATEELMDEILFGQLKKGGSVKVDLKDDSLTFEFNSAVMPAVKKPTAKAAPKTPNAGGKNNPNP